MSADPLLRAVSLARSTGPEAFPFSPPAIKGLERLELHPEVTFLVGENGSGYRLTRAFLDDPDAFLRHLFAGD